MTPHIVISLIASSLFLSANERPEKPNIILIMADDIAYDNNFGAYGAREPWTPRLDQMAQEGTTFEGDHIELYDLKKNRNEDAVQELSKANPEVTARLKKMVLDWYAELPTKPDPACLSKTYRKPKKTKKQPK